MARDPGLEELLAEHLDGLPGLSGKPLFHGWCWLMRGHLVCGARDTGLLVRLGPDRDGWALDLPGIERMRVGPRRMPGWVWVRAEAVADDGVVRRLIDAALAFVATLPDKEIVSAPPKRHARCPTSSRRRRRPGADLEA